jgi:hypothetical protein
MEHFLSDELLTFMSTTQWRDHLNRARGRPFSMEREEREFKADDAEHYGTE